jgi:hypothetical protein
VARLGLSAWTVLGLVPVGAATFYGLALLTKVARGAESLTYYHHQIVFLPIAVLYLRLLGQPALPYLDLALLGAGFILGFGRLGCLLVGCCHGRPSHHGVRYGAAHAGEGFPPYLVGVTLFPIQLIEAMWVLAIVAIGSAMALGGAPAGSALAWYLVAYGLGRFGLELGRGDRRRYWAGFSEAQWLSLLTIASVALAEAAGWLPVVAWHGLAAVALPLLMAGLQLYRTWRGHDRPAWAEWRQMAAALARLERADEQARVGRPVAVANLDSGVRLSVGASEQDGNRLHIYTFSSTEPMSRATAQRLAAMILRLRHPTGRRELFESSPGVFHLVVRP